MIAVLSMYDRPETRAAYDALWAHIRDALYETGLTPPSRLTHDTDLWQAWEDPDLILGQTCGLPFRSRLHEKVQLVGTLDYGLFDIAPGYYYSDFVVRADTDETDPQDFATARLAYNQPDSQSGWAAPQTWAAARGFSFLPSLQTGGHRASALAIAEDRADIAALDAITFRQIIRWDPDLAAQLKIIGRTDAAPGLPLITAQSMNAAQIRAAVTMALENLSTAHLETLGVVGLATIPSEVYLAVPNVAPPVQTAHDT